MRTQKQKDATIKWKKAHPEKVAVYERERQLKNLCGITRAIFSSQFDRQGKKCPICGTANPGTVKNGKPGWHADHDHKTGKFRGVLCQNCNKGLGHLKDSPILLMAAILYIIQEERHAKTNNVELVEVENGLAAVVRSLARNVRPGFSQNDGRTKGSISSRNTSG